MKFAKALVLWLLALPAASFGAEADSCPTGSFAIAGSSTVLPVAELWAKGFMEKCTGVSITAEGGGSSAGAGRVCANEEKGSPVQIGDMSRGWKVSEASTGVFASAGGENYIYKCRKGNTALKAIQIDVAIDGLSVATRTGGLAEACIMSLGGLTMDQLRWIFSNYNESQLTTTGWDPRSLDNSDGNPATHLWSELTADCPPVEIKIAGADSESGTYDYFLETVFADHENGETFDRSRPHGYTNSHNDEDITNFLISNQDAIGYLGYAYYNANMGRLSAAPIENDAGMMVAPDAYTVADGFYNPLSRRIYMNLVDEENALKLTSAFIKFGLSDTGSGLVKETGYIAIPGEEKEEMLSRIGMLDEAAPAPDASAANNVGVCLAALTTALLVQSFIIN